VIDTNIQQDPFFIGCGRGLFWHLGTKFYLTVFAMENHCYKGENITIHMKVQESK